MLVWIPVTVAGWRWSVNLGQKKNFLLFRDCTNQKHGRGFLPSCVDDIGRNRIGR